MKGKESFNRYNRLAGQKYSNFPSWMLSLKTYKPLILIEQEVYLHWRLGIISSFPFTFVNTFFTYLSYVFIRFFTYGFTYVSYLIITFRCIDWQFKSFEGPCGLMDKASDFGSEDCRFEFCQVREKFYDVLCGNIEIFFEMVLMKNEIIS